MESRFLGSEPTKRPSQHLEDPPATTYIVTGSAGNIEARYQHDSWWVICIYLHFPTNVSICDPMWINTLPETNIAPENGWLEYDRFLWDGLFSGAFAVSFRECNPYMEHLGSDDVVIGACYFTGIYATGYIAGKFTASTQSSVVVQNVSMIRPAIAWGWYWQGTWRTIPS